MKNQFYVLFAVALLFSVTALPAADFLVDPSAEADLIRAKGAAGAPLPTIQRAADLVQPGDRIILADGDYFEGAVIRTSGTPDDKVVVKAANLKKARICNTLRIEGDHVRIEGLHFDGGTVWNGGTPVRAKAAAAEAVAGVLELQGTHADVIGVTFSDYSTSASALGCSQGTRVANCLFIRNNQNLCTASDCLIENNEFTDMRGTNTDNIRVFGKKVILRNNYIYGTLFANTGDSHVDCFQAFDNYESYSQDILLESNWCFGDYHQGIMLENDAYNSDYLRDWTIRNNVFCNFTTMCITAGKGSGIPEVNVVNNIFMNGTTGMRCIQFDGPRGTGQVKNNIFFWIRSNCMYTQNGAKMDASNNLLYLSTGPGGGVVNIDGLNADPLFNKTTISMRAVYSDGIWSQYHDKTTVDLTLQQASPCIDAGTDVSDVICWAETSAFNWDIAGNVRPTHEAYDIGPYEYTGPAPTAVHENRAFQDAGFTLEPNPMADHLNVYLSGSMAVGTARLTVFDGDGRVVRDVIDVRNGSLTWDGRTAAGRNAAPGMYHYRLVADGTCHSGTIMKSR